MLAMNPLLPHMTELARQDEVRIAARRFARLRHRRILPRW